jgi:hypothetical protein
MADNARFMTSNRIKNDANYAAAFCDPAFKLPPASHAELVSASMYSTPILQRYRQMFEALSSSGVPLSSSGVPLSSSGVPLSSSGLTRGSIKKEIVGSSPTMTNNERPTMTNNERQTMTNAFYNVLKQERTSLLELKALLTGEKTLPPEQLQQEITRVITEREYLYLHFPDGHKFTWSQSFLNRVRVEVDYFLKVIS